MCMCIVWGGLRLFASCNIKEGQNIAHGHTTSSDWLDLPRGLNSDNFLACSASIRSIVDVYLYGRLYCFGGVVVLVVWVVVVRCSGCVCGGWE